MAEFILHFFIYSILGYISEVIYCSIPQHRFVNRGFLYGPYLPIYGFGGLIVYVLPAPIKGNIFLLFASAFVLTSCLEYFTSWLLEKCFSVKLWDYSKHFGNINGRVCLLNSTLFGIMGNAGQANYSASKAGVIGLTKSAARELASRGITVNAIAPGFINTEMTEVLSDKVKEGAVAQIPLGKFGETEDIANAVAFLASEGARYITGQVLNVDGGMAM